MEITLAEASARACKQAKEEAKATPTESEPFQFFYV